MSPATHLWLIAGVRIAGALPCYLGHGEHPQVRDLGRENTQAEE